MEKKVLQEAIRKTVEYRKTSFHDIVVFEDDFYEDTIRQSRWKAFVKKKKTD